MTAFHFQALTKAGASHKGIIEADSERQARQNLREQGLILTKISAIASKASKQIKSKLTAADLALFTRQLATLLSAGIPVEEALQGVSEQLEKPKVKDLIIGVRTKVLEGFSLADAFGEFPQAFPELYRATVGAGEQTGRLDLVLNKLADYTDTQQKNSQKIQQALIYPSIMIFVSVTIVSFLLTFVVPKIIEVFSGSGQTLPPMTELLINISNILKSYGLYLLLTMVAAILGFKRGLKNEIIQLKWHDLLLKLPIIRYMIRSTNVARYVHTFGILFAAGVSVLETMRVSAGLVNNLIMRQAFSKATVSVREGMAISTALKSTKFLSPLATHLIASGEKSGQISEMMERTAAELDNDVKRLIDTGLTLLEPMVILLMGAIVLFIVLATLLPIFSMEQLVN